MKSIKIKFLFRRVDLNQWYSEIFCKILQKRYHVQLEDKNPDFIFHDAHLVDVLKYDGVRIAFTSENVRTDFNISDYGIGFDHLQFQDRYLRFPLYLFYSGSSLIAQERPDSFKNKDIQKLVNRKFCNFLVSNGVATEFRSQFFDTLSRYRIVDSGGRYLNNIGGPVKDKSSWQSGYKFSLCFENSSTSGYLTEKLIQAYAANTVQIYWGDPDAFGSISEGKGGINPEAVIWVDPNIPESAVLRIKELDTNHDLYMEMLKKKLFLDQNHIKVFEEKLENFLFTIFDQERNEAYRRGFGQVRLRVENRNISRSSKIKSLYSFLKKRLK